LNLGYFGGIPQAEQDAGIIGRTITSIGMNSPPKCRSITTENGDTRAEHVSATFFSHHPESYPRVPMADIIDQKPSGTTVVHDDRVYVTVVINITKGQASANISN
jgi:hypothetical protein